MRSAALFAAILAASSTGCFTSRTLNPFSKETDTPDAAAMQPAKAQELPGKPAALLLVTMAEGLENVADRAARRLAVLYDRADEQAKAMHEFQEQLKKKPKDASLLNDMGYSLYNRGQWAEAENYLRRAVSQDKNHKPAWVNLGLALAQQGKDQEALEAFSHAVSTAEAYSNLGFVLAVQGKKPEAIAAYRRALELEPALKIAQAAVQRLEAPSPAVGE